MTAQLIDGKAIAAKLRVSVSAEVADLARQGIKPGLAVVLVGEDPASQVYVRNKAAQTAEAGMESFEFRLPADTSEAALLALIEKLNADPAVDGILLQLPLPVQIEARRLLNAIDPSKDVDGFHPVNVGLVASGAAGIVPCTPLGSMLLLKSVRDNLSGLDAVVVGRSNIVGKPMAHLLTVENCTVTVCHSKSRDIPAICRRADILIAAVGRPEMIRGDWVKPGATIIDVGINRLPTAEGKPRLVGDVRFAEACEIAGAITPVPGGVGPMTIACLLSNTVSAARRRRGLQ
jgi:methylenetetrahydrofolate dehydrogenase (NADP+) / methenyltetrahydrofolate cyclohydrolase